MSTSFSESRPLFQSTLPLRGATLRPDAQVWDIDNFNPRSPYGERRRIAAFSAPSDNFNPRSPYGERPGRHTMRMPPCVFQSTLPLRGATYYSKRSHAEKSNFNPRFPYGERQTATYLPLNFSDFNPRFPYGERHFDACLISRWCNFNPRFPYGERLLRRR